MEKRPRAAIVTELPGAQRPQAEGGPEQRETATQGHLAIEPAVVGGAVALVAERRQHERRQRPRRVLELEVAIRNGAERNGVAVALVDPGVGDLVAVEEAVVEQGPGPNEDAERDDDDERRRRPRQKGPRAV